MGCLSCYDKVERITGRVFEQYGGFVARNPWTLIVLAIIANGFLGLGISRMEIEDDIELLYTPSDSQASKDRTTVQSLFGDTSGTNFYPQSQSGSGLYGDILFQSKKNILSTNYISEIKAVYDTIIESTFRDSNGVHLKYGDVCAMRNSKCVITGDFLFTSTFEQLLLSNNISYPMVDFHSLKEIFGNVEVKDGILHYASLVKLRFNLREDINTRNIAKMWMNAFLIKAKSLSTNKTDIYYAHSDSLSDEISSNLDDDIILFALTFIFMILYASLATANWKCISDKQNLARAGVLATLLSILGSIGLVSSCHVKFVSVVGVMPFLILGIGVDDMFVLLSGLAETYDDVKLEPEARIKKVMKTSGVGITITTLTDLIAFYVGASSSFLSVKNFCIYTGVAVLFCYLNYLTFFMACMTLHEQRIQEGKHCCSYRKVKSVDKNYKLESCMCSGSQPTSRDDIEGPMEKYPQKAIAKFVTMKSAKVIIIALFAVYLGISVWGSFYFEQGLDLNMLVDDRSYLYKYNQLHSNYFTDNIPISFVLQHNGVYSTDTTWKLMKKLQKEAENDVAIDSSKTMNWLEDFQKFPFYDNSSEINFIKALRTKFLPLMPFYKNDIVFDNTNTSIRASRFFVFTSDNGDSNSNHEVMPRMRNLVKNTLSNEIITYSPAFIFFEQYLTVFPETIQSLGMTVLAIFVVTSIFLPHPVLIFFITLTLVMILVGLFGFMYFWNLSLSFLTMIHIIMSIGFSVDFSAHICHAFMDTRSSDRQAGAHGAIKKSGAPIFNGALSSFIGIFMLVFSKSYIFQSFFKVMMLIILFGSAHSLLFLPTILSLVGPKFETKNDVENVPSVTISVPSNNRVLPCDRNGKTKFSMTLLNFRNFILTNPIPQNRRNSL